MALIDKATTRGLDGNAYEIGNEVIVRSDVPSLTERQRRFVKETPGLEFISDRTFGGVRDELLRRFGQSGYAQRRLRESDRHRAK